jgi:hypothetical protein
MRIEFREKLVKLEHESDMHVPETGKLVPGKLIGSDTVHGDVPGILLAECAKYLQEGGFPCSGSPYNGHHLTGSNF